MDSGSRGVLAIAGACREFIETSVSVFGGLNPRTLLAAGQCNSCALRR